MKQERILIAYFSRKGNNYVRENMEANMPLVTMLGEIAARKGVSRARHTGMASGAETLHRTDPRHGWTRLRRGQHQGRRCRTHRCRPRENRRAPEADRNQGCTSVQALLDDIHEQID